MLGIYRLWFNSEDKLEKLKSLISIAAIDEMSNWDIAGTLPLGPLGTPTRRPSSWPPSPQAAGPGPYPSHTAYLANKKKSTCFL